MRTETITLTSREIDSLQKDFERIAKESVTLETMEGHVYAYCSELASLRLLKAYRNAANADAGFSENLNKFYFHIDLTIEL